MKQEGAVASSLARDGARGHWLPIRLDPARLWAVLDVVFEGELGGTYRLQPSRVNPPVSSSA
jgi:hypothetical protein